MYLLPLFLAHGYPVKKEFMSLLTHHLEGGHHNHPNCASFQMKEIPNSHHHLHVEPDTVDAVFDEVQAFLEAN